MMSDGNGNGNGNGNGGWRKSSWSINAGNCVEVGETRKSTHSWANGDCVEVGSAGCVIAVRDTVNREGGTLTFSAGAWRNFTASFR
jgi:hypothetical protein